MEALGARRFAVGARAADGVHGAVFDIAELGGEEDIIAFAGALEPAADELFAVAVEAEA
jgi:hypothetical protein